MFSKKVNISFKGHSCGWPFLLHTTAGESILIGHGFVTAPGSVFTAEIRDNGGCQTTGVQPFKMSPANPLSSLDPALQKDINGVNVYAFPNPTNDRITAGISNNNYQNVSFIVTDISGRVMAQYFNPTISTSDVNQNIDASSFAQGIYIVTVTADKQKYSFKFAKE